MQRLRNKSQRGFALIMALVLIALVSAIVAEFQYSSRVGLQLAVQARDSLQAEQNAMSAMRVQALFVRHARKLKTLGDSLFGGQSKINLGAMLQLIPVECGLLNGILKARDFEEGTDLLEGECLASVTSEQSKIALNILGKPGTNKKKELVQSLLAGMLLDPNLARHFEEDDRNGQHAENPLEVVAALGDWIDPDSDQTGNAVADEDRLYDMLDSPYESKNAAFDSIDEVQLVYGIDDELFSLLKPAITIYNDSAELDLATLPLERILLWGLPACLQEGILPDQMVNHPGFIAFVTQVSQLKQMADFGMGSFTVNSLKEALNVSGMMPMFNANALGQVFTDNSKHLFYTIEAEGGSGDATRKVKIVLQANEKQVFYGRIE